METGAPVSGDCEEGCNAGGVRLLSVSGDGEEGRNTGVGSNAFCFWRWWGRLQRRCGFDCFLSITDGSVINCFLAGTKTGLIRYSPLPFSPFCVYIFWFMPSFFWFFTLFWVDVSVLDSVFFLVVSCLLCFSGLIALFFWIAPPPGARFSVPFYRDPQLAPSQSCLCRTVSSTNEIVGKGRGPRLDLLQIFRSPVESGWRRSHGSPTSNDDVSAKRHIFTLTPELWKFGNWTPKQLKISFNFAPFWLISIKSLNWYTVYKIVFNS